MGAHCNHSWSIYLENAPASRFYSEKNIAKININNAKNLPILISFGSNLGGMTGDFVCACGQLNDRAGKSDCTRLAFRFGTVLAPAAGSKWEVLCQGQWNEDIIKEIELNALWVWKFSLVFMTGYSNVMCSTVSNILRWSFIIFVLNFESGGELAWAIDRWCGTSVQ